MAHFQIIPMYTPTTARHACYLCSAARRVFDGGIDELLVDTGIDIDFEGRLVFCQTCVVEMAGMVGCAPAAMSEAAVVEAERRADKAEFVQSACKGLQDAVDDAVLALMAAREKAETVFDKKGSK